MTELLEAFDKVILSDEFKEWKSENKNSYLCSFFLIIDEKELMPWQLAFYSPSTDTITSFIASNPVKILEKNSKIFKMDRSKINELHLNKVNIDLKEAFLILERLKINIDLKEAFLILERLKMEKYPNELPTKKIVILQKTKHLVWNITYINSSLNILNVKVDAASGEIIEDKISSIMSLKEQ
ncbi:PepSY domain-containing protein [Candidatus Woesearchaeota archaeon]|nr:PepSY domain-containing protein [Candidatus Woesearchaeota archaeon]